VSVTPRFEIFYALRALNERSDATVAWRQLSRRSLPTDFRALVDKIAPHPMMWPLLADALRDASPDAGFPEILHTIQSADDHAFQQSILSGIFRDTEIVTTLVAGERSLGDATRTEAERNPSLLTLMGLYPFDQSSDVAVALARIIDDPVGYRVDLANALHTFWSLVFRETWRDLQAGMIQARAALQLALESGPPSEFARDIALPVTLDDRKKVVASLRGRTLYPYKSVSEIHVIPSAFNDARLWAAYSDTAGSVRLYFPVFRPELLRDDVTSVDAATAFRALGDTTRYAIASVLAHEPQTSVELAKAFGVSKATISHHVQLMRAAGLLEESATDNGIVLALDRDAVEGISEAAVQELFGAGNNPVIRRSRRQAGPRAT
jgi:DNA-binding transcriptional ArsR family regulator